MPLQGLADERRSRQQHCLYKGKVLIGEIRITELHVGFDLDPRGVLDLENVFRASLDNQEIAFANDRLGARSDEAARSRYGASSIADDAQHLEPEQLFDARLRHGLA